MSARPPIEVVGNIAVVDTVYAAHGGFRFVGGAAVHFAQAAAKAGANVSVTAVVGHDLHTIRARLGHEEILVDRIRVATNGATAHYVISYDAGDSVLEVTSVHGVADQLTQHASQLPPRGHRHLCCRAPLEPRQVLEAMPTGAPFSVDFFVSSANAQLDAIAEYLPRAKFVFVNAKELELLHRVADVTDLECVVATAGADECRVLRRGATTASVRPRHVTPVEVTGAGDTLAGAFLARALQGDGDEPALRYAVHAATQATLATGLIELPEAPR